MAEFTYSDLQKVWKGHGFTNWQIAEAIGVSEDVVKSWLRSDPMRRIIPHPDDVGNIEHACHAEGELVWHRWMMSNCESYRERHQEAQHFGLLGSMVSLKHEAVALLGLHDAAEQDAVDGAIDDPSIRAAYRLRLEAIQARATAALAQIPKD